MVATAASVTRFRVVDRTMGSNSKLNAETAIARWAEKAAADPIAHRPSPDALDQALKDTFPASDVPAATSPAEGTRAQTPTPPSPPVPGPGPDPAPAEFPPSDVPKPQGPPPVRA